MEPLFSADPNTRYETIQWVMAAHVGPGGAGLIGVDLKKDLETLLAAYDDRDGVTARFNLNLLARINRELGGEFDIDTFEHQARWNVADSIFSSSLISRRPAAGASVRSGPILKIGSRS